MDVIRDIHFNKPKMIKKQYLSYAHNGNNYIEFTLHNVDVKRKLYKKGHKIMMDITFDKDSKNYKILKKLENNTISNVCQKYEVEDYDIIKDNFVSNLREADGIIETSIEVNKYCVFIKDILFDKEYQDTYKLIEEDDGIDIKVVFIGIVFGKSNYKNLFMIKEVIKTVDQELELNGLQIEEEYDNDVNDTNNIILDQEMNDEIDFQNKKIYINKEYEHNVIELSE